ncbi:hypothetical protein AJ79_06182 [Helicocarpus griseus UAMH5409]|uniref:Nuclear fusion protein KAR5 n=1 Tax=Helicocarpus griseus UAMH5409 TaxID=1447875 RepID=A0A2B7X805_9EURO|nr:hypothetical protein AJ79_06182 [Helicocarpus griseus UAMH5409]
MRFHILTAASLYLGSVSILTCAHSLRFLPFRKDPKLTSPDTLNDDTDLSSLLHAQSIQHSEVLSTAIGLLDSMRSSPSCNRMAATNLILSCQSLGGNDEDQKGSLSESLDNVKSLFAARLAVCELIGAGAGIPAQCSPIFISPRKYPHVTEADLIQLSQLEPCLKALESRPQWWTSYSNSRQNAAVMCQGARVEIEREDQLKRYKDLANITSILTEYFNQSLTTAAMEAFRQQEFLEAINDMRDSFFQDMEDFKLRYYDMANKVFSDMEGVGGLVSGARSDAVDVKKDLHSTTITMHNLKQVLDEIHLTASRRASEMAAIERKNHEENMELVSSVRRSVELLRSRDLRPIVEEVGNIFYSMQAVKEFVSSVEAGYGSWDLRLQLFDQAFQQFETTAVALQQVQMQQMADQKLFQTDLRISQALLKDVTATVANLQTSVDSISTTFSRIASLGGAITAISWWILAMVIVFLAAFYPRLAAAIFISLVTYSTGLINWIQTAYFSVRTAGLSDDFIYFFFLGFGAICGAFSFLYFVTQHIMPRIRYMTRDPASTADLA